MNSCAFVVLFFIKLQIKKVESEAIPKVEVISYCLCGELWLLAMATSVINRCSETALAWGGTEQTARMAADKSSPMEKSWTIFKEYHIDEDVGFALPLPLVREDTGIWAKLFSYLDLPG